jgi:hypothetical protein
MALEFDSERGTSQWVRSHWRRARPGAKQIHSVHRTPRPAASSRPQHPHSQSLGSCDGQERIRSAATRLSVVPTNLSVPLSDPRDNQSIIDLTHRQLMTTKMVRESLSYSCSPNAARTLQLMREQAPNPQTQAGIDANIQRAEPQRRRKCDEHH